MKTLIKKHHDYIFNNFDLGSGLTIVITIQNDKAMITNSAKRVWGQIFDITEIGNQIAETIMLKGLSVDNITWGNWYENQKLIPVNEVMEIKQDNLYFDVDMAKLWTMARIISNQKRENNKIYEITYSDTIFYNEYTETEYKEQLENWDEI